MVAAIVKSGLATGLPDPPEQEDGAANADPWANIFRFDNREPNHNIREYIGVEDEEDGGIYRCVDCHHEIEDGICSHCGREYAFPEDVQNIELYNLLAGVIPFNNHDVPMFPFPFLQGAADHAWDEGEDIDSDSDDLDAPAGHEHDEDVEDGEVGGYEDDGYESSFIDDEDDDDARYARPHGPGPRHEPLVLDQGPIDLSDDEEDVDDVHFVGYGRRPRHGPIILSDEEDDRSLEEVDDRYRHHEDDGYRFDDEEIDE